MESTRLILCNLHIKQELKDIIKITREFKFVTTKFSFIKQNNTFFAPTCLYKNMYQFAQKPGTRVSILSTRTYKYYNYK